MLWIQFDECDHHTPAPFFCLPSVLAGQANGQICLQDYHEDCNLALFFTHGSHCPACLRALQTFATWQADYRDQEAKIAAVFPEAPEKLVGNPELSRLDFPLLCDPANKVRQAYRGLMAENLIAQDASGASFASMLFLLDRYNAPYAALIGSKASRQAGVYASAADYVADVFSRGDVQEEILGWLRYISIQCPE